MKYGILILCLFISLRPIYSQLYNIDVISTDSKKILKAAGSYRGEHFAYSTEDGLNTIYNNKKILFASVDYVFGGTNYSVSLINNIKEIACNIDGRIYVTTKDSHIIMFEEGKFFFGLPLLSNDLHQNFAGLVCMNLFLNENWYVAELLENPLRFDDMFESNAYPEIQSSLNLIKPDQVSINEQYFMVVTGLNKKDIAYPTTGNKLKWQKNNEAYLPCEEIIDISSSRILFTGIQGVFYQIYSVYASGDVWAWTRKLSTNNDQNHTFTSNEWEKLDFLTTGGKKVKKISHSDINYLIGCTDGVQNNVFVFNIIKKAVCLIDLPGSNQMSDFFYSYYEGLAVVAAGNQLYAVKINPDKCTQSSSLTKDDLLSKNVIVLPNPSNGQFYVNLPEYKQSTIRCKITDLVGHTMAEEVKPVLHGNINFENLIRPGVYFLMLSGEEGYYKTIQFTIQ